MSERFGDSPHQSVLFESPAMRELFDIETPGMYRRLLKACEVPDVDIEKSSREFEKGRITARQRTVVTAGYRAVVGSPLESQSSK